MQKTLIIIHVIISAILILVVLMQHGKQQGLSGAIAGGAETFFGKNKGRTIDALLNKVTTVVAVLFVASAITLTVVSVNENKKAEESTTAPVDMTDTGSAENIVVPSVPESETMFEETVGEETTGEETTGEETTGEETTGEETTGEETTGEETTGEETTGEGTTGEGTTGEEVPVTE